jgi:hypothetical protein
LKAQQPIRCFFKNLSSGPGLFLKTSAPRSIFF